MAREHDVKAYGTIARQLRPADVDGRNSVYEVEIAPQDGEHLDGTHPHVSGRIVQARPSFRMVEHGVRLDVGDTVALLVNPRPNAHVCAMIARIDSWRP
jgi:hypothetical protein